MADKKKTDNKIERVPIVAILGHVDHGKTTILDKIRDSNVQEKEAGGITQKISVFTIEHEKFDKKESQISRITFVDTPGHEAFDLMRERGGEIADIILLVVAANDGLKPQTEESIEIIKRSKVKPIVVLNKIDLPNVNVEKVKRDLATKGIQVEGYGGDVPVVEVSGKTGEGLDLLLDTISLVIDVEGLNEMEQLPEGTLSKAYVLESLKDQRKGHVSTVIVTRGDMESGNWLVYRGKSGPGIEKVKGFISESGENIPNLSAGEGGKIIGLSELLDLGSVIFTSIEKDKKLAKELMTEEVDTEPEVEEKETVVDEEVDDWLSEMFSSDEDESEDVVQQLNVILKSSSEGSLQALISSVEKVDIEGYTANIIQSSVGEVTLGDVERAEVTKSIILAFEVDVESTALKEADKKRVLIRQYDILYKLVEEISDVLTAMATPAETEEDLGDAEIREVFLLSDGTKVLGGRVMNGTVKKGEKCYIVRNDDIIAEGKITSLKHGKNDIVETQKGTDFGAILSPTPKDAEVGDNLYCVKVVK